MKTTKFRSQIKLLGLFAVFCLIAFGCKKEEAANSCKTLRAGDLICEQASGYKCSDLLWSAEDGTINGRKYFILNESGGLGWIHYTCEKFHYKISVELKDTLPGLKIDMVISHGLTSDTIYLEKNAEGIFTMDEYIIDLPTLYPNLDIVTIHYPVRLWFNSTGSFLDDYYLAESVLTKVYAEHQVGRKE